MPTKKRTAKLIEDAVRDPRERFVDLANKRVTAAILQLRLVGNLANRKNYEYEADDAKKIIRTLQAEVSALKARFQGQDGDSGSVFTL